MVERLTVNQEVVGSSPTIPVSFTLVRVPGGRGVGASTMRVSKNRATTKGRRFICHDLRAVRSRHCLPTTSVCRNKTVEDKCEWNVAVHSPNPVQYVSKQT